MSDLKIKNVRSDLKSDLKENQQKDKKRIKLTLPYPPTVNKYHRLFRYKKKNGVLGTRFGLSEKVKQYYKDVYFLCAKKRLKIRSRIEMHIILYAPDQRVRDLSNTLKVLEDSLVHAFVINDDALVKKIILEWGTPKFGTTVKNGKVDVIIYYY